MPSSRHFTWIEWPNLFTHQRVVASQGTGHSSPGAGRGDSLTASEALSIICKCRHVTLFGSLGAAVTHDIARVANSGVFAIEPLSEGVRISLQRIIFLTRSNLPDSIRKWRGRILSRVSRGSVPSMSDFLRCSTSSGQSLFWNSCGASGVNERSSCHWRPWLWQRHIFARQFGTFSGSFGSALRGQPGGEGYLYQGLFTGSRYCSHYVLHARTLGNG